MGRHYPEKIGYEHDSGTLQVLCRPSACSGLFAAFLCRLAMLEAECGFHLEGCCLFIWSHLPHNCRVDFEASGTRLGIPIESARGCVGPSHTSHCSGSHERVLSMQCGEECF